MPSLVAAAPGLAAPDLYAVGLVFAGVAIAAAVGALSHERDRAFSVFVSSGGAELSSDRALELARAVMAALLAKS